MEEVSGKTAIVKHIEDQVGDVPHTWADTTKAKRDLDYEAKVSLKEGLTHLYHWVKDDI